MTKTQQQTIAALRQQNYPCSFIAQALELNVNTVKSVCRRKGFRAEGARKTKSEKQNTHLCKNCHRILPADGRKGQMFCSDACRMEWWKIARRVVKKETKNV